MKKGILCIVGPSGSGKTTMANKLKAHGIPELTSHTTRSMRSGEIDGESYHFVTNEVFEVLELVERSVYAGNQYGLSVSEVSNKLKDHPWVSVVTDIHGMKQIKEIFPDTAISIFLDVTLSEMSARMEARGDSAESIAARLSNAKRTGELNNGQYCDYVVRNDNVEKAFATILQILA